MSRSSVVKWVLIGTGFVASLLAIAALYDNRERKLEVYRAFVSAYSEGRPVYLANVTTRFDAETEGVLSCAPTVLATTLLSRLFRTTTLRQSDFQSSAIRVVDAPAHLQDLGTGESDIDGAVADAFDTGLLQVSEVGFDATGQHAMLTFSFTCGHLCGHGGTALLDRVDDRWVWSQRLCGSEWMS